MNAEQLHARWGGVVDRLMCTFSLGGDERERLAALR